MTMEKTKDEIIEELKNDIKDWKFWSDRNEEVLQATREQVKEVRKQTLEEVEKMIDEHKDCKEYHKSFSENKKEYFKLSCIAQILIDLQKLKQLEKKEND